VLAVYGADDHDGRAGLWTDLLHGKTLHDFVTEQGTLGFNEAAHIGIDLCGALAALHGAGLVHRDIKPANVMREQGGRIVLMDLGAAGERFPEDEAPAIAGTPLFMAPEILLDRARASSKSDIYALGVVLFWLVSGRLPVEGSTLKEICDRHRKHEVLRLRDVRADLPTPFVQVVERAVEPDPEKRYGSAGEMELDLAQAVGSVSRLPKPETTNRWRRARRMLVRGLATIVVSHPGSRCRRSCTCRMLQVSDVWNRGPPSIRTICCHYSFKAIERCTCTFLPRTQTAHSPFSFQLKGG
jgi:serine/threonine protein kinase